jgi:site-specific DNA-cytosine methylase
MRYVGLYVDVLSALAGLGVIPVGTVFLGCEVASHVLRAIECAWLVTFGTQVTFETVFMCESDPKKQFFLKKSFPACKLLFTNAAELRKPMALDAITKKKANVPAIFLLILGFLCEEKSPCSSRASSMKSCVQNESGNTGGSFTWIADYIRLCLPKVVVLENMKEMSDGMCVIELLKSCGYAIAFRMLKQAPDHGSPCQRTGMFFIGIRIDRTLGGTNAQHKLSSNELIQLTRLLVHCLGVDPWPAELFLDFSEASQQEAEPDEGRLAETKTRVEKGEAYKHDHYELFPESGLAWPPTIDKSHETMRYRKSKRREQEMMYYLDKVFGKDQVVQPSGRKR